MAFTLLPQQQSVYSQNIAYGPANKEAVAVQSDEEETLAGELEQMPDEIDENQRLVQTQLALICRQLGPLRTLRIWSRRLRPWRQSVSRLLSGSSFL